MKYKKNDEVIVTIGKDKGKKGKIEKVIPKKDQVIVAGINISKRHKKSQGGQGNTSGIVDLIKPMKISKVQLICPKCKLPTRVGYRIDGKEKLRICRKCKDTI